MYVDLSKPRMLICVLVEKCPKVMSPDLKMVGLLKFKAHQSSSPKISWKLNKNTVMDYSISFSISNRAKM